MSQEWVLFLQGVLDGEQTKPKKRQTHNRMSTRKETMDKEGHIEVRLQAP